LGVIRSSASAQSKRRDARLPKGRFHLTENCRRAPKGLLARRWIGADRRNDAVICELNKP
jgi:hypothetical protein